MPEKQTAIELPTVLNIVNIKYQGRDWRYPASIQTQACEPNHTRSIFEMTALVALLMIFSTVTFGIARWWWWWFNGHPGW